MQSKGLPENTGLESVGSNKNPENRMLKANLEAIIPGFPVEDGLVQNEKGITAGLGR